MNVLVPSGLTAAQRSSLVSLLERREEADGHPALAEPGLGADGVRVVLGFEGDALVGCAVVSPAADGAASVHVAVDPAHGESGATRAALIRAVVDAVPGPLRLWAMQATPGDDALAASFGFAPERDVLQMQVPLPLPPETVGSARPVVTRAFEPGRDEEAWLSVNNRAFAGHPEQGGWTPAQLRARMAAPWFEPDGFRVADAPDGDGLIGSCWTKIHRRHDPVLGEIYVIAVDPERHGEGWGRALTVAGLEWLAGQGVPMGMLYTDASNSAAVALYASLGFTIDHADRSYTRAG